MILIYYHILTCSQADAKIAVAVDMFKVCFLSPPVPQVSTIFSLSFNFTLALNTCQQILIHYGQYLLSKATGFKISIFDTLAGSSKLKASSASSFKDFFYQKLFEILIEVLTVYL